MAAAMKPEVRREHQWLQRMVGEWTFEVEMAAPGGETMRQTGTELVRALGDAWVVCEGEGDMDGELSTSLMTLGYDPARGQCTGTFVSSMMTHLWVYDGGALDAAGSALTLECDGPSSAGDGTMARYRDVIELQGDDRRTLSAFVRGADGAWTQFMTTRYRRTS
jgi:hypothetical protein